jgi:hypothetical protein
MPVRQTVKMDAVVTSLFSSEKQYFRLFGILLLPSLRTHTHTHTHTHTNTHTFAHAKIEKCARVSVCVSWTQAFRVS